MQIFFVVFAVFLVAVAAMAVGLLRGRELSGSCGGVGPDGEPIADCLCELQNAPVCDARKELLALSRRKAARDAERRAGTSA